MVADETPIALDYDGFGYAVLMATPRDLADLAYGFSLSERLIERGEQILRVETIENPVGRLLRISLDPALRPGLIRRVRHRVSDSACGLCGIENLEQAIRPLPRVAAASRASERAIFAALAALGDHQPLNRATGAAHAAALCDQDGNIRLAREDVGRHNAFDKLVGAMLREGLSWDGGFALLSSRCSYELVEKAALAGCPLLVTISAPTSLALARAQAAGLPMVVLARADAVLATVDGPTFETGQGDDVGFASEPAA